MGRLPQAWIAPAEIGELRELTRYRIKLVRMRSSGKEQVHAVLAKLGIPVTCSDLFGVEGNLLLDKVTMPAPYKARIASLCRFIEGFDAEIDLFTGLVRSHPFHVRGSRPSTGVNGHGRRFLRNLPKLRRRTYTRDQASIADRPCAC